MTEGQGIYMADIDGRRFIDGLSGTFRANLGQANQALADASSEQLHRLALANPTLATNDGALELMAHSRATSSAIHLHQAPPGRQRSHGSCDETRAAVLQADRPGRAGAGFFCAPATGWSSSPRHSRSTAWASTRHCSSHPTFSVRSGGRPQLRACDVTGVHVKPRREVCR